MLREQGVVGSSSDWLVVRSSGASIISLPVPAVWGPCASGQHTVNVSHLVWASAGKTVQRTRPRIVSMVLEEEIKALDLV